MSIDRLYVVYEMTDSEYSDTFLKLKAFLKTLRQGIWRDKCDTSAYLTTGLSEVGFQEIRMRKTWNYRSIEIRLYPELLKNIDGSNYYGLPRISDFGEVGTKFDHILQEVIGLCVPSFFEWRAKRVEYTVDLYVGEELIPKLLFLYSKGNIPIYMLKEKVTQMYIGSDTNLYLYAPTVTVNWYDRYRTLQEKEQNSKEQFRDYSVTKGILRFEIQCKACNVKVHDVLSVDRCRDRLNYFYDLIIGAGDYYTFDKAKEIIIEKVKSDRKRKTLTRLLELIDQCGSVWAAKLQFAGEVEFSIGTQNQKQIMDRFSSRLGKLRDLGINPVCLPSEWGISRLENLDSRIQAYLEDQRHH
ncbi:hypothetical protein [Cohnella yongneupensis]|uniref:Uncharacterized protein n=1 Tax=Cohnella yongneupensis TaxID=425006 RepID=A0ABW0R5Z1_9BACL